MAKHIPISLFIELVEDYFKRLKFEYDDPIFNIGDAVKTKADKSESYISKVIGSGKKGIVISKCSSPLIDFGKGNTYYVCQKKLIKISDKN